MGEKSQGQVGDSHPPVSRAPSSHMGASDARLRELTMFLDSIVENLPQMVFVKDAKELRYIRFNRASIELLRMTHEELAGKTDFELFPREQAEEFQAQDRAALRDKEPIDAEQRIETESGPRWVRTRKIPLMDADGAPAYILGISEDITVQREMRARVLRSHEDLEQRVIERTAKLLSANEDLQREIGERKKAETALRSSEDQLRQAQKMEAIGQLAGGVAHDFNNLLSVILGYTQIIAAEVGPDHPTLGFLREIETAGMRASKLTKQLLAFGRKQVLVPRVVDLSEVIQDMATMLRRIIGEDIDLRVRLSQDPELARLDPTQVEQVIMNLVLNARDAMPQGGRLTIETRHVELDAEFTASHHGITPGSYVMLAVSDTGVGMDSATQARAFEPFFTTKADGRGTGLGLSTVFGIVRQSGGTIWIYSEVGSGTTIKIYFPRVIECEESEPAAPPPTLALRGHETVLLVEDEPNVRALVESVLARQGYTILEAASADDALRLADSFEGTIDLLLTDVVLPRVSGTELAARMSEKRPGTKVLFMSGYTGQAIPHSEALPPGAAFLEKPVGVDNLTRRVRDVLG